MHSVKLSSTRLGAAGCAATLLVTMAAMQGSAGGTMLARKAKTIDLVENAHLEFVREEGSYLLEHGSATGTYNVPMTAHLARHATYVTAVITLYPQGGSITGKSRANYIVKNDIGYFGGNFAITGGTGKYRHASGKALGISGTINRHTFDMTVKAHGNISF